MVGLVFGSGMVSSNQECHWLLSAFAGIVMCKLVYDLTGVVSLLFFKGYAKLNDWLLSFRGFSTFHALVVAIASLYLFLFSNLFDEDSHKELIIDRRSTLSDTILGISIRLFFVRLSDDVLAFSSFRWYGIYLASWTIYFFNLPLPRKQTRTGLHNNGSLYRVHYPIC
ncbi:hypothetical protein CsSME_00016034 [Camellia sinensis var. sinensis]